MNLNKDLLALRDQFFSPFESEFDKVFDQLMSGFGKATLQKSTYPKVDILEENGCWIVKASIPGVKSEDIDVTLLPDNVLQIQGKMSEEHKSNKDSVYYLRELKKSNFLRQIKLPEWAKGKDPEASLNDGILRLSWELPKTETKVPEVRRISLK